MPIGAPRAVFALCSSLLNLFIERAYNVPFARRNLCSYWMEQRWSMLLSWRSLELADMAVIDTTNLGQTIEMAKCLAPWCPDMSIVAVMDTAATNEVRSAFAAGIRGCIFKRVDGTEFVRILESIGHGGFYVPPELGAGLLRQDKDKPFKLTPRETQILACVERGLTNKEIARELQISEKTVKHYMTVIMQKLQVRNRVEAALKAKAIIEW